MCRIELLNKAHNGQWAMGIWILCSTSGLLYLSFKQHSRSTKLRKWENCGKKNKRSHEAIMVHLPKFPNRSN